MAAGVRSVGGLPVPSQGALLGVVVLLAGFTGLGFLVMRMRSSAAPTAEPITAQVSRQDLTASVSTTGTVVSTATSKLAFKASGRIGEVLVVVGDQVAAGQILARQDASDLEPAVLQAQANLLANEAKLAAMLEGPKREDVVAAQASVEAAQAKLAAMEAGSRDDELVAAQTGFASAQARLDHLTNPDVRDLAAARAAVDSAQARLDQVRAGPTQAEIVSAQASLSAAHNARLKDSVALANVKDSPSQKATDQPTLLAAMAADDANIKAAQAKLDLLLAGPTAADVSAAESALQAAQQKLDLLLNPTEADVIAGRAGVEQARSTLTTKLNPYTDADFLAQQQAVKTAAANLAAKREPYANSDILTARAAVVKAQADLATAQANLAGSTLIAPFNGVVSQVVMSVGETANTSGGAATSSITVVDPSQVRVDVQVDEADIARVEVGQAVRLSFDALQGRPLQGRVIAVAPSGTLTQGVVGYPVSVELRNSRGVRAGMTATAEIVYQRKEGVLSVPNRAIVRQGRDRFVDIKTAPGPERKKVELGMANDQFTEITSGLAEGDTVIIPQTTARASVPGGGQILGGGGGGPGGPVIVGPGGGGAFRAPAP